MSVADAQSVDRARRARARADRKCWYALYTRSNYEARVATVLRSHALEAYLPTCTTWRGRGRARRLMDTPAFPGYLFVHCALTKETWLKIIKTIGVVRIIGYGDEPLPIPDREIESLRKVLAVRPVVVGHAHLREGHRVRVVSGPLTGVYGTLVQIARNRHKLVVAVEMLDRAVSTTIDARFVEPCDPWCS